MRPLPGPCSTLSLVTDGDGELLRWRRSCAATSVKSPRGPARLVAPAVDREEGPALVTAAAAAEEDEAFGLKLRRREPEEATRPRQAREKRRFRCDADEPSGVVVG